MTMQTYIIERDLPGVGGMSGDELCGASTKSNEALAKLAPAVQWVESFVAADKTFCVYRAEGEEAIRRHAEISGFPATKITKVATKIDPTTGA